MCQDGEVNISCHHFILIGRGIACSGREHTCEKSMSTLNLTNCVPEFGHSL